MEILLILALVVAAAVAVRRWQIAARGQRLVEPPDAANQPRSPEVPHSEEPPRTEPSPPTGGTLPLRPRAQMDRALWAARGTRVRSDQTLPPPQQ